MLYQAHCVIHDVYSIINSCTSGQANGTWSLVHSITCKPSQIKHTHAQSPCALWPLHRKSELSIDSELIFSTLAGHSQYNDVASINK